MNQKITFALLGLFTTALFAQKSSAQNELDAFMLSQSKPASTALSLGMGGVGGSMGGDFNALSINPAGVGVYRSGEFTITPSLKMANVDATFDENTASESKTKFSLSNIGIVFHQNINKGLWKSFAFGLGMNTLYDFNSVSRASGTNFKSSISDIFSASAHAYGVEQNILPPYGFLGYQGYLIDEDYAPIVPLSQGLLQSKTLKESGHAKDFVLNFGANYNEQFLIGATIGIQSYIYNRYTLFSEDDATDNPNNYFSYADLIEQVNTSGIGINLKLGAIYLPSSSSKIGLAIHTPSWASMSDVMDYRLETNTENFKSTAGYPDTNPESIAQVDNIYQYDYNLQTPWKAVLSGTVLLSNKGMISADYEFIGYSAMKYKMPDFPDYEKTVNQSIKDTYKPGHVLRIGGEAMLGKYFLRAGAGYHTNPYQVSDYGSDRLDLSIGAGVRFNQFFIDLGLMHSNFDNKSYLYNVSANNVYNPLIAYSSSQNVIALTLGYKFRQ